MKGVIVAGGKGTRLSPITKVINKHLLPVFDRPMIYFPIQTLFEFGIKDVLLITSPEHVNHFIKILGYGKVLGINLHYEIQDQPNGIAHAFMRSSGFVGNSKVVLLLGDNIIFNAPKQAFKQFKKQDQGAMLFLKTVENPQHFGIAHFDDKKRIVNIEEKPKKSTSNLAVTGMYFYNPDVFSIIEHLSPSKRGELEITDVNNFYAKKRLLTYNVLEDSWIDAGSSLDNLFEASCLVKLRGSKN